MILLKIFSLGTFLKSNAFCKIYSCYFFFVVDIAKYIFLFTDQNVLLIRHCCRLAILKLKWVLLYSLFDFSVYPRSISLSFYLGFLFFTLFTPFSLDFNISFPIFSTLILIISSQFPFISTPYLYFYVIYTLFQFCLHATFSFAISL